RLAGTWTQADADAFAAAIAPLEQVDPTPTPASNVAIRIASRSFSGHSSCW
ncbi:MAG: hypothetical protein RLZZ117_1788, partial [Cyanobacteriota bacterium]